MRIREINYDNYGNSFQIRDKAAHFRPLFVSFNARIAFYFKNFDYLCSRKAARTGGV